ncbi:hypothetical protein PM082_013352 [Marasmius tenuissimus]|nr:hypothetical protein PM082_013352 [Marasmius tenuissimus]
MLMQLQKINQTRTGVSSFARVFGEPPAQQAEVSAGQRPSLTVLLLFPPQQLACPFSARNVLGPLQLFLFYSISSGLSRNLLAAGTRLLHPSKMEYSLSRLWGPPRRLVGNKTRS